MESTPNSQSDLPNVQNLRPDLELSGIPNDPYQKTQSLIFADVAIVHPAAPSYRKRALTDPSSAIVRIEHAKISKYSEMTLQHNATFIPVVMESYGLIGKPFMNLLKSLSRTSQINGLPCTYAEFLHFSVVSISVALQHGSAIAIQQGIRNTSLPPFYRANGSRFLGQFPLYRHPILK